MTDPTTTEAAAVPTDPAFKLELGQAVTFPHEAHKRGGVITERFLRDGSAWYVVTPPAGEPMTMAEGLLYAKTLARAEAQQQADAARARAAFVASQRLVGPPL